MLGHSTIGVTQSVYVHLFGREEAEDAFVGAILAALVLIGVFAPAPEKNSDVGRLPRVHGLGVLGLRGGR